jgi:glucose-specific phosphotransferase system IIA component
MQGVVMFGFLKTKKLIVVSPVDGDVVALENVSDEVFSQKMAGDGVAILPRSNIFIAPVSGVVTKIFATNHAFSIQTDMGIEVLVHIGIDTVALNGRGFERLIEEGSRVSIGKPIINADLDFLLSCGKDIVTPIVLNANKELILNSDNVRAVREGESIIEAILK